MEGKGSCGNLGRSPNIGLLTRLMKIFIWQDEQGFRNPKNTKKHTTAQWGGFQYSKRSHFRVLDTWGSDAKKGEKGDHSTKKRNRGILEAADTPRRAL